MDLSAWPIQAGFVGAENGVHGVLEQAGHSLRRRLAGQRWDGERWALLRNTAEIVTGHSEQAARDA